MSLQAAPELKVCTVLHENKSSKCLTHESANYPTTRLIGISKTRKGEKFQKVTHKWNGQEAEDFNQVDKGRVIISSFEIPSGFKGQVEFSIINAEGEVLVSKKLDVQRGPLNITAFVVQNQAVAETLPPLIEAPEGKPSRSLPSPEAPVAKSEAPLLDKLPETKEENVALPEVHFKDEALPVELRTHEKKVVEKNSPKKSLVIARLELHGAYISQSGKTKGDSFTAIPYWAPEWSSSGVLGLGGRVGYTKWKSTNKKTINAVEGDLHLSLNYDKELSRLSLQPTYGYHSWGKFGNSSSLGANLVFKNHHFPLSLVAGYHVWERKKIDHQMVNLGLGFEF